MAGKIVDGLILTRWCKFPSLWQYVTCLIATVVNKLAQPIYLMSFSVGIVRWLELPFYHFPALFSQQSTHRMYYHTLLISMPHWQWKISLSVGPHDENVSAIACYSLREIKGVAKLTFQRLLYEHVLSCWSVLPSTKSLKKCTISIDNFVFISTE